MNRNDKFSANKNRGKRKSQGARSASKGSAPERPGQKRKQFAPGKKTAAPRSARAQGPKGQSFPATEGTDRLEGRNPIKEAIRAGRNINKIWVKKSDLKQRDTELSRLINDCKKAGAVVIEVEGNVLDSMSASYAHQGIIAQVAAHEYFSLADLITKGKEQLKENIQPLIILLDGLEESYNLGSILRIADAAGAVGIVIPERRSVALDALVAKSSAGAIEYVPVARVTNLNRAAEQLKEAGYWVYGADASGKASPEGSDWLRQIALVIGSEGKGISERMLSICDHLISIPQYGMINSLNAAVACGILTYEARRQARENLRAEDTSTSSPPDGDD